MATGEAKETDKHSHHGIELARKMVDELFPLESNDDMSPYEDVKELCQEYGLEAEWARYEKKKIYGE